MRQKRSETAKNTTIIQAQTQTPIHTHTQIQKQKRITTFGK